MRKRYIVVLSEQERARLQTMVGRGVAPAGALTHARILLKANQGEVGPGWTDAAIGAALEVNPAAGWTGSRRPIWSRYLQPSPEGHKRWTLRLLADRLVEQQVGGVGVVRDGPPGLEANRLKPWLTQRRVHPARV